MIRYVLKRIILLIPVIIAVSFIVYTLVELTPGDVVDTMVSGKMSLEDIENIRVRFGLDKPMLYRYGLYMLNLVQGNLGISFTTNMNVFTMYMSRLPNTLILSFTALIIGVAVSIPLGILSARRAGTLTDAATTTFALAGVSMPSFWLGLLLILLFAYKLDWLPAGGDVDGVKSLILPSICSAMTLLATSVRQTRSSMLEVLRADYLRTARAKGAPEDVVIRKHALGNALIPIITAIGGSVCVSLAGSAVIEQVFAWPGVGRLLVAGMIARDVPLILGCSILSTILYVVIMLIVDVLYAFVDPRIKSQYTRKRQKRNVSPIPAGTVPAAVAAAAILDSPTDFAAISAESSGDESDGDTAVGYDAPAHVSEHNSFEDPLYADGTSYAGAQDYVTRQAEKIVVEDTTDDAAVVMKKYKKRSQMGEIVHRLARSKSAMAGFIILAFLILIALGSLFMSYDSIAKSNVSIQFSSSSWKYPFGTDNMGRNAFLRVLYGSRYSLVIGFSAVMFSAIVGVTLGSIAAYYGGKTENIIMRASDVLASLPGLLLGMVIMVMLGRKMQNLIIAVGVAGIPHFIRMSRASILTVKGNEYVEAARATGFSDLRIIATQVLPNGLSPIIVQVTALIGLNIIFAASLSFLGFGIPPPIPEWGALVSAGREYIRTAPWLMTYPGLFIMITVLGFNLLGDGLRDALDPKLKK